MRALLFALVALPLWAVNLLTYNIYERDERVDIMLSFDAPYNGTIKQQNSGEVTTIILSDVLSEEQIEKKINSKIVQNIFIASKADNKTNIELKSTQPILITASKTTDKFGLRIRAASSVAKVATQALAPKPLANIPTKQEDDNIYTRYVIVILVLFALFVFAMYLRAKYAKKIALSKKEKPKNRAQSPKNSPFGVSKSTSAGAGVLSSAWNLDDSGVEILYEKELDGINRVALLSYENQRYLVLVGSSNVLLDKFGEEKIQSQSDFDFFFQENKNKLGKYLEERKNALNSYKDMMDKDA